MLPIVARANLLDLRQTNRLLRRFLIWIDRRFSAVPFGRHSTSRRRLVSAQRIEALECRLLLSESPVGFAAPDYVSQITGTGIQPAATSVPTGYTPQTIKQVYAFNQVAFRNGAIGDGSGTTIAIVDAYDDPNIANDVHQFDLAFGLLDPLLNVVNQTGGNALPAANRGWITEIALDVEWSHAIAPKANILLVEANSNSLSDLMTAVNYARGANGVVAVSMSWGGGEFSSESSYDQIFTTPSGHAGVSFVVASGDSGSPVEYPAASPNVLSVGGTSLYSNQANYSGETGWSGSGGGISSYESKPGYQNGIVTQSNLFRTNPDVAYDANPSTGFPVYDSYNNGTVTPWGQWGGTSDAAPQWAALVAIADQGRAINGLGSLDGSSQLLPNLYQLPTSEFHDITTGVSAGNPIYSAGPGYDLVTGRGTPIANLIINDLAGQSGSNSPTHFSVTAPASIVSGSFFSITVNALTASNSLSATYQGTIQFSSTDSVAGVVLPPSYTFTESDNGSHTFTGVRLVTPGTQSVSVNDSANNTIAGSTSLSVLVFHSPPALSGNTPLVYVKHQMASAISPTILITDMGITTLSSVTITITNVVATDDVLSFINDNQYRYGNITSVYNNMTGKLILSSAGSTATVDQFQSALRAVTYFNQSGDNAILGTRFVEFQASNGRDISNVVTSPITISNDSTNSAITSSGTLFVAGQSVTLVSTIGVISPGTGVPTAGTGHANVKFVDGNDLLPGSVSYNVVNGKLVASLTTTSLTPGYYAIKALYSGDANFSGSSSVPQALTIAHAGTTCVVTSSISRPVFGVPLTFTATVGVVSPGAGVPTAGVGNANVKFMDGSNVLPGTVRYSIANGSLIATLTTPNLSAGVHTIAAIYSGDGNFLARTSVSLKQAILSAGTVTTVTTSSAAAVVGQSVTFTATVSQLEAAAGIPSAGTGNANVKFLDGNNVLPGIVSYNVVNGNLTARLTTSNLQAGLHQITVLYSGDVNFSGSSSAPLIQKVGPFSTVSTLSSSGAVFAPNQLVTLVSTVGAVNAGVGIPTAGTGTSNVKFVDGSNVLLGTVSYSVISGKMIATLTTSSLVPGNHVVTAIYSGDANFSGSSSTPLTLTIARVDTTCVVNSSIAQPVYGVPLTFTATVGPISPGAGIPTAGSGDANVKFMDGSNALPGAVSYSVVNGNLTATLTTPILTAGVHVITATYSGDANFSGRTSSPLRQVIQLAGTVSTVSTSAASAVVGQPVTLTATVSELGTGTGIPTAGSGAANVKFMDGSIVLPGTVSYNDVNGKLIATLTTSGLTAGVHAITATYSGDVDFSGSSSAPLNQIVGPFSTRSHISSSSTSFVSGQLVTLVSTVGAVNVGTGIPTAGTTNANVMFMNGSHVLPGIVSYSVDNGNLIATLTTTNLVPGYYAITAIYSGDANFSGSSSNSLALTIFHAGTTCVVSSSVAQPVYGLPLTFTATVAVVSPGAGVPTAGTGPANVQFLDGSNVLAGTVSYSVVNGKLVATLTTSSLPAGVHAITAIYSGDANFLGRTSISFRQTILVANSISTISTAAASVVAGQSVTLTANVGELGAGTGIPTAGTGNANVKFRDGSNLLPGTVSYSIVNGDLIATLTTSSLIAGVHLITANYSGDANFSSSVSTPVTVTITRPNTLPMTMSNQLRGLRSDALSSDVGVNPITFNAMKKFSNDAFDEDEN